MLPINSKIAVIDIGTNTCLMLIAEMVDGGLKKILDLQESPRLGEGLKESNVIARDSMKRTAKVIKDYNRIAHKHRVDRIFAFGTSPFRDARNVDEVIEYFYKKVDLEVEVFSGETEARFGFYGATYDLPPKDYAVIDIGGGSTELSFFKGDEYFCKSVDFGSVKGKEMFFKGDYEAWKMRDYIKELWEGIEYTDLNGKSLVGIAGTPVVLAAMYKGLAEFEENKIHGLVLSKHEIKHQIEKLSGMKTNEILNIGSIMNGREDIILPGAIILESFMDRFDINEIIVSTKGARYGVFLYLIKS